MRKIICPYCFGEFEHDEVHFRLETVKNDGYDISDIEYESDPQKKEEMQLSMYFQPKEDEKYENFWKKYGETTELTTQNEQKRFGCQVYQLPIVNPKSPEAAKCLKLQNHPDGKSDYFIYDDFGRVQGVEDIYGIKSHRRVCPYCHNPLPRGYGKNEVKFISVIGITGSGKTVYISQLLKNMPKYTFNMMHMSSQTPDNRVDNFLDNNPVRKDTPLPDSTMAGRLAQPMTYDIVKSGNEGETIVIYDIAGENCKNAEEMERYGDFVMHSHGIILLISPKQIGIIEKYGGQNGDEDKTKDKDTPPPKTVLNTIYNTIVAGNSGLCEIPLAVCISKSDFFARSLGEGEENGNDIVRIATSDVTPIQDPVTRETKPGFNATQYNVIQKKIAKMLARDPISGTLQTQYKHYNYFIFSATGCDVRTEERDGKTVSYPVEDPNPIRIAEPLLWLFKRFGYIKSDTHIRLPALRGDPNQKVIVKLTRRQKVENFFNPGKNPEVIGLDPDQQKALWYEETL